MACRAARALVATLVVSVAVDAAHAVPDGADTPTAPEPSLFAARRRRSGDESVDASVRSALDWLSRHRIQGGPDDGGWSLDEFPKRCAGGRECAGAGVDFGGHVAPTALALLAFLGAGETTATGDRRELVAKALGVLLRSQGADGCFGPRTLRAFLVAHAAATSAVAEAYWATKDPALREPLTKARDFLIAAQNAGGGWRYEWNPPSGDDTFMTASASLALRTVEFAGVDVPKSSRDGALAGLDGMTDAATGRVGYLTRGGFDARIAELVTDAASSTRVRGFRTEAALAGPDGVVTNIPTATIARYPVVRSSAMTAAAALVRALTGGDAATVDAGARFVAASPPSGRAFVDLHGLLFGSMLFAQTGGGGDWRRAAVETLRAAQRPATEGCAAGSFDPGVDPWGAVGGRVYATAMAALVLEAPTRFPRVYDPNAKKPPPKKR